MAVVPGDPADLPAGEMQRRQPGPRVTYQEPQMKYCRSIIRPKRDFIAVIMVIGLDLLPISHALYRQDTVSMVPPERHSPTDDVMSSMQSASYDAIVVGSGISGGWAAKELTERGLRVLLLERGRNVEHIKDYVNATKAPWEYLHRGGRTIAMEEAYQVLKRDLLNEKNLAFWVNEKESPYTEVKRFDWFRGYQVGGRSLTWGRQSYRWSDFDFRRQRAGRHRRRLADSLRGTRALVRPCGKACGHLRLTRRAAAASRR